MPAQSSDVIGGTTTQSSELTRLSELWRRLPVQTQSEIERRAKANGLSLLDQLRFSLPAVLRTVTRTEKGQARPLPTMPELLQALEDLIELMKRP
ncbi:MAG TPA: hypothetical protein VFS39_16265 [Nitrospira sp.]|nr:hypothetical protein [Nitrospira sp.]